MWRSFWAERAIARALLLVCLATAASGDPAAPAAALDHQLHAIEDRIERLRWTMGRPEGGALGVELRDVGPHEVLLGCRSLLDKTERLLFEQARQRERGELAAIAEVGRGDLARALTLIRERLDRVYWKIVELPP